MGTNDIITFNCIIGDFVDRRFIWRNTTVFAFQENNCC